MMRRSQSGLAAVGAEAVDLARWVRPGDFLVWGQGSAEPCTLTGLLKQQCSRLVPLTAFVGMSFADTFAKGVPSGLSLQSYCATGSNRKLVEAGELDIWPGPYSELPRYLEGRVDVLLLAVSPPDDAGRMSLGLAHEYLIPLLDRARVVIAEINGAVPFTFGTRPLHPEECSAIVTGTGEIPRPVSRIPTPAEVKISEHVASLVEDGATLQTGIGSLPDAILSALCDRRDLGLHSGMVSDGCMALVESGALTNARKAFDRGVSVAGMAIGSQRFCSFLHRNPNFSFRATSETHNAASLAAHNRFVAINAALEVDLTGQINAEAIGGRYIGAVGGAGDFLRGAARSKGGLPIIVLPSTTGDGATQATRIVARLKGPVSTTRSDAGIVVTENGIADLRDLTLRARRERMLAIAAPQFRGSLAIGADNASPSKEISDVAR
jgi:acetyl-CoA hydrolase